MTTTPLPNYDEWLERPYYDFYGDEVVIVERDSDVEYENLRDESLDQDRGLDMT
jgi:hypothetical protein